MTFEIQRGVALQAYNTMAIPASATALVTVENQCDLNAAFEFAQRESLPTLVLGEGSNIIFEKDFSGLVILNRIRGIEQIETNSDSICLRVGAGESWHDFVVHCLSVGAFGLENLALIPGLVGAAPIQNIGAYGVEVKDTIESVTVYDIETAQKYVLTKQECDFAYRDSRFKHELLDKVVIIDVVFKLSFQADLKLSYPALTQELVSSGINNPTPQDVFNAVCKIRSAKLPQPKDIPNTGSFFKNPLVTVQQYNALKQQYPELVSFELDDKKSIKLAAAWLIEHAGWKQQQLDGICIHKDQALVITNPLHKDGITVMKFARAIQADIHQKYGLVLEVEPRVF